VKWMAERRWLKEERYEEVHLVTYRWLRRRGKRVVEVAIPRRFFEEWTTEAREKEAKLEIFYKDLKLYPPTRGVSRVEFPPDKGRLIILWRTTEKYPELRPCEYVTLKLVFTSVITPPVYRINYAKMWYSRKGRRYTPEPFAFLCVYVYTKKPEKHPVEEYEEKMRRLEEEYCESIVGMIHYLRELGLVPEALYYDVVEGYEKEEVDVDEVEYPLDEQRFYVAYYRGRTTVEIYKEYYGHIIKEWNEEKKKWEYYFEPDEKEPIWMKIDRTTLSWRHRGVEYRVRSLDEWWGE